MKILYLTTCLPSKQGTGGDIASQHFINALKQANHLVSVVGYSRKGVVAEHNSDVISVGERYIETKSAKFYPLIWSLVSLLQTIPYSSAKYYSKEYIHKVEYLLKKENYDVVLIEHSSQLIWLQHLIPDKTKLGILAQNIEHEVYLERLDYTKNPLVKWIYQREAHLVKQAEDKLGRTAQQIWTLTQHDADYFVNPVGFENKKKIKAFDLPSSLENVDYSTRNERFDIGMIGSWIWKPNLDGLRWFFQAVYPHLPPHLSIQVAGRGAEWLEGLYTNVCYRGFVPDAREFMAEAKVIAIPGIRGAGVQIKTLDAIGVGSPIVATPYALRGISNPPSTVKVAEEPEEFAKCLISVISSPSVQEDLSEVIEWTAKRRDTFWSDVAAAVEEFRG